MSNQSQKKHLRWYPPHHFFSLPFSLTLLIWLIVRACKSSGELQCIWIGLALTAFIILYNQVLLRQHYALTLQDRLIRAEMRLRYFRLSGKAFESIENNFSVKQIVALRFAGDEELVALVDKALQEKLSPGAIKRNVKNWQVDNNRV